MHPDAEARVPFVTRQLADVGGPVVAVSDFMRAVPDLIARWVPTDYASLGTDIPHRLLVTGRVRPREKWLVLGILDWHSGVPYSVVDEMLDFVGPRNALRFPVYSWLELGVERRFKIFRWQPWIGVRAGNALGLFLPTDVQNKRARLSHFSTPQRI